MQDSTKTIDQLKALVRKFVDERDWDQFHTPKDMTMALATEAAEMLEIFRFRSPSECEERAVRVETLDELADCLYWVLRFADRYNIDLSKALEEKLAKSAVKYPIELSRGRACKYTELQR